MSINALVRGKQNEITFDDLKGKTAEGYIRDSTEDQRDGFGPEMQKKAIENFARIHGIILGETWYTDFITGTSTLKRSGFQNALIGAELNQFDILLVYHTSRFTRNRADAIRYKAEFKKLGKTLIFVSQNIVSGRNTDFLNEGMNEVFDENYSRTLSGYVTEGLFTKHDNQIANGKPPLGYKSEKYDNGKHEIKVPDLNGLGGDPKKGGMEALLYLLRQYSTGHYSYDSLAEDLTVQGYRTRLGTQFTKGSVEHILSNRFYEGKVVYHPDKPDEDIKDGKQVVPEEVRSLWIDCQKVKLARTQSRQGRLASERRAYPFSKVSVCDECGRHYGGHPGLGKSGEVIRRLYHNKPFCPVQPHSIRVENIMSQFQSGVLPYIQLDQGWKNLIISILENGNSAPPFADKYAKIEQAMKNLRKQHLWGDITDEDYRREKQELQRQTNNAATQNVPATVINFDKAAQLLSDLPALWKHPGTTDKQRESLLAEVFDETRIRGHVLVAVKPKPRYQPLFAYATTKGVRKCRGEWI